MGSFFLGMDPYLEDPGGWAGVHDGLIARLRTELNRQLGPDLVADAGTSEYVAAADEHRWIFPDIYVIETQRDEQARRGPRMAAPVQVLLNVPETVSQQHILIRDRQTRRVLTIIDILSPINKAPDTTRARQDFLTKRHDAMASATNWVEIGLREPLPRIGIPIRADVDDIAVELQPLLDRVYDEGRYADLIDYAQSPPAPALPGDEARWVAEQVERWLAARSA